MIVRYLAPYRFPSNDLLRGFRGSQWATAKRLAETVRSSVIPRVTVMNPKSGPAAQEIELPGNTEAFPDGTIGRGDRRIPVRSLDSRRSRRPCASRFLAGKLVRDASGQQASRSFRDVHDNTRNHALRPCPNCDRGV